MARSVAAIGPSPPNGESAGHVPEHAREIYIYRRRRPRPLAQRRRLPGGRNQVFARSFKFKQRMDAAEDMKALVVLVEKTMDDECGAAMIACLPPRTRSMVGLLSQRGMNKENPDDAAFANLLSSMNAIESKVSTSLSSADANGLRALHMMVWKAHKGEVTHGGGMGSLGGGTQAEEDAAAATKAVKLYRRLDQTQGVKVPPDEQLSYSLLHKFAALLEKNGTINAPVSLSDTKRQCAARQGLRTVE